MITNMVRGAKEKNAGRIIKIVAEKYLMIPAIELGSIVYDKRIDAMVSGMVPLTKLNKSSEAVACAYEIATKLV
jgi:MinD-like ATPase involved in chromosome partitioning or flagellar assembly